MALGVRPVRAEPRLRVYCDGGNGIEATAVSDVWVLRGPSTADAKEGLWKKGAVAFVS